MQCPACDHETAAGARFCESCGARLARTCPACKRDAAPDARFCGSCGAPLGEAQPAPRPEAATGERRQLSVLFCDLVGSTELASRLDPEDWREIVRAYHKAAADVVARFGGHVAQWLGDGLLAYFGWPKAYGDDAERAVRAGLGLVDATPAVDPRFAVRVGIHTGPVVVGEIGDGTRVETLALGETPNIAARLQALADPGTVLLTETTQRLVAGLFQVEPSGTHVLKGVPEPVALFRALRASGVRGLAAAIRLTPLVGREEERALLRRRFELAREGSGQVVLIVGEPGIGKSRLVRALHDDLASEPHTWLECGGSPYFESTPFYAVTDLLAQFFRFRAEDPEPERITALERALEAAGLKPVEALPLVAPLVGLAVPEHYPPQLASPVNARKKLLATLAAWVLGTARLQPLVMVLEDLHWVDPSTLELQHALVEQCATAPLLLVYSARPEFHAPWPLRAHHAHVARIASAARSHGSW